MAKHESRSEVARLRQQIAQEYEAAWRGFYGYAEGAARHDFINQKLENMALHQEQLKELIGEHEAINILVDVLLEADQETKA